jgi:hypothetical protein
MTRFYRNGFLRTSVNGQPHWVEGHWVERENWDHAGYSGNPQATIQSYLAFYRANRSSSARFINPNAKCPLCGTPVFFYQNEAGSRVFFDEIGPPWPKHPCTDSTGHTADPAERKEISPEVRDSETARTIAQLTLAAESNPAADHLSRYGLLPWDALEVARRIRGIDGTYLILRDLASFGGKQVLVRCPRLPRSVREGGIVFLDRGRLSFFDFNTMNAVEVRVTRFRSAAAFVTSLSTPVATTATR